MIIYKITNLINGKVYVGQTTCSLKKRFAEHCSSANSKKHVISRAINKHGKENFEVYVLQECKSQDELDIAEKKWIKKLNTMSPNGYNLREGGNGGKLSEETKRKIGDANRGKKRTQEVIENMKKIRSNRILSEETKRKISESNKGKKRSDETRKNMSGRKCADETKQKISNANKGRKFTDDHKNKISKKMKGKPWSEKRRQAQKDRKNNNDKQF